MFHDPVFEPGIVGIPQYLDDAPGRGLISSGRSGQGRNDDLPVFCSFALVKRNLDVVQHAGVQGHDEREARMRVVSPDDGRELALQNPHDGPLQPLLRRTRGGLARAPPKRWAPRLGLGRHLDQNPVPVHGFVHVPHMHENILLVQAPVVRGHEAVTVPVAGQHA